MGMTLPPLNQIVLIQVQNSADVAAVQTVLQAHLDQKIASDVDYNVVRWRDLSRIVPKGNYVMLVVNENCDAIVADFNALF